MSPLLSQDLIDPTFLGVCLQLVTGQESKVSLLFPVLSPGKTPRTGPTKSLSPHLGPDKRRKESSSANESGVE